MGSGSIKCCTAERGRYRHLEPAGGCMPQAATLHPGMFVQLSRIASAPALLPPCSQVRKAHAAPHRLECGAGGGGGRGGGGEAAAPPKLLPPCLAGGRDREGRVAGSFRGHLLLPDCCRFVWPVGGGARCAEASGDGAICNVPWQRCMQLTALGFCPLLHYRAWSRRLPSASSIAAPFCCLQLT